MAQELTFTMLALALRHGRGLTSVVVVGRGLSLMPVSVDMV